jgi:hypothetical protein
MTIIVGARCKIKAWTGLENHFNRQKIRLESVLARVLKMEHPGNSKHVLVYYWKVEQVIESADGCRMMHDSLTPDQVEMYCPGRRTTTRGWISSTRPWRKFPLHFTIFVTSASPTIILAQEGRDLHLERTLHNGECLREEPPKIYFS